MNLEDRIAAFEKLGKYLSAIDEVEFRRIATLAKNENSWFTEANVRLSLASTGRFLNPLALRQWIAPYHIDHIHPKTIAVVMAGNIPMVGFHDVLCVLVSGHRLLAKLSSKDSTLMRTVIEKLIAIEPRFTDAIRFADILKGFDAVIATGSDNSARYFEFYFGRYPHIIRKNRTSCAILSGFETEVELVNLGQDVFSHFGLGCRNVSKLFVPEGYDFGTLFRSWEKYDEIMHHHKYHNNYDYQKSIMLLNRQDFLDTGYLLLQQSDKLVSPISVLYFEYYRDWSALLEKLRDLKPKLQCVVGNVEAADVRIGQAQSPGLTDYADQIDTMKFLEGLGALPAVKASARA